LPLKPDILYRRPFESIRLYRSNSVLNRHAYFLRRKMVAIVDKLFSAVVQVGQTVAAKVEEAVAPDNSAPAQPAYTPVIPPPEASCSEVSTYETYLVVSHYTAVADEIRESLSEETIEDYYNGEEVSDYASSLLENYGRALEELDNLELCLFEQAFLSEPDPAAETSWRDFEDLAKEAGIGDGFTQIMIGLADPHLNPADRLMLYEATFGEESDELSLRIEDRFVECWAESNLGYNGWGTVTTEASAFVNVFGFICGEGFPNYASQVLSQRLPEALNLFSDEAAQRYLGMNDSEFMNEYEVSLKEFQEAPLGSNLKITAYQRYSDLATIAYARGMFNLDEPQTPESPNLTELNEAELDRLENLPPDREGFLSTVEYFAGLYLSAEDDPTRENSLRNILEYLDDIAPDFGISWQEMDNSLSQAAQNLGISLRPDGSLARLEDINQDVSVSPDGLPPEVREILEQTGYGELVSEINEIRFFTGEIQNYDYTQFGDRSTAGQAAPFTRYVEIEVANKSAWEIAAILVHEAAHVAWREEAIFSYDLESLPNERHSFLTEADFLSKYQDLADEEERASIYSRKSWALAIGLSASSALGSPNNINPDSHLMPTGIYLESLGLSDISQFDFNVYPTDQARALIEDPQTLSFFIRYSGDSLSPQESEAAENILTEVLRGDVFLSGSYAYENNDAAVHNALPAITLVSDSGPSRELTSLEVTVLVKLFGFLYDLATRHHYSASGADAGYHFTLSAGDLIGVITGY